MTPAEAALVACYDTLAASLAVALVIGRDTQHEDEEQAHRPPCEAIAAGAGPQGARTDEATRRGEMSGGVA